MKSPAPITATVAFLFFKELLPVKLGALYAKLFYRFWNVDHVFEPDQNDGDFAVALIEATMAAAQSSSGPIWSSALARWRPVDWSMRPANRKAI
jgi:hypothetical protein